MAYTNLGKDMPLAPTNWARHNQQVICKAKTAAQAASPE